MFRTVLIANRGEIALRVARTCRELGIRTVAVHSTADRDSAVVRFADEAVHIGPPSAKASYLHMPSVMEAALRTGADAIHPGYGFLSEDPDFAEVCEAHGVTFIGPPPRVMEQLGDKAMARRLMAEAGLPVLPGSTGAVTGLADARKVADRIGYPLILKAVAGGGGRGIAVVRAGDQLTQAFRQTSAHARAVFGDDRLYVERFVEDARHIEVQVLCDRHGGAVHLGERDCSVQRRYQKLIEEAPAPNLPDTLRTQMCDSAVRGALAVGYVGAATFEFVVAPDESFHLMEVNCRLQVEHPVTEMSTGIDLVREQLLIAAGRPLSFRQEDLAPRGWSMESRVNAEDPDRDFAPTPGLLTEFTPPGGPFVRVDSHAYPGWMMGPDYDSLLAKTVVWAPDREQAVARMDRALGEFRVGGPGLRTTIGFLREILAHPTHRAGRHTTGFVAEMMASAEVAARGEMTGSAETAARGEMTANAETAGSGGMTANTERPASGDGVPAVELAR